MSKENGTKQAIAAAIASCGNRLTGLLPKRRLRVQKGRLGIRILVWLLLMGLVLTVVTCFNVAIDHIRDSVETIETTSFSYAKGVAQYIDGDSIDRYEQTLEKDGYYQEVQELLNAMQQQADLINYFYVFVPEKDDFVYIWDAKQSKRVCEMGEREPYPEKMREAVEQAFRTDPEEQLYFANYRHDYLGSAFYPVFNTQGKPVALVGVSMTIPNILNMMGHSLPSVIKANILVVAVFMVAVYLLVDRKVVHPIRQLKRGMKVYRQTMDSAAATEMLENLDFDGEIAALLGDFVVLMVDVDNNTAEVAQLTAERERIGTELKVATSIQAGMLPRTFPAFPERKEFDLYATMNPAKEVGGDFYDFFLVDEDHLCMVMADVSGKGVPAALFMAIAKALIKSRAKMGGTPSAILADVNNQLCEDNQSGMFVTVWLAILEISTGRGMAANAGHEHPVLRRAGGSYELVEYRHSPAVAFMKGIPFREHPFQLFPGDRIVVYTDGVAEATNTVPELYGTGRMLDALNAAGEATPEETLGALRRSITEFENGAEQFDDITMLCLDYFGPEAEG